MAKKSPAKPSETQRVLDGIRAAEQKRQQSPPAKSRNLTAIAATASKSPRQQPRTWLDELSAEDRRDVMAVAAKLADGTLTNIAGIADAWREAGLNCSRSKLSVLVNSIRRGIKR